MIVFEKYSLKNYSLFLGLTIAAMIAFSSSAPSVTPQLTKGRPVGHGRKVVMLRDAVYTLDTSIKRKFWRTCAISLQHLCSKAPIKFSCQHSRHMHRQTKEC